MHRGADIGAFFADPDAEFILTEDSHSFFQQLPAHIGFHQVGCSLETLLFPQVAKSGGHLSEYSSGPVFATVSYDTFVPLLCNGLNFTVPLFAREIGVRRHANCLYY